MAICQHERQALEAVWRALSSDQRDESRIGRLTSGRYRVETTPVRLVGVSEPRGCNSREKIRVGVFVPCKHGNPHDMDAVGLLDAAVLVRPLTEEERAISTISGTNQRVAELLGNISRETGDLITLHRLGPRHTYAVI